MLWHCGLEPRLALGCAGMGVFFSQAGPGFGLVSCSGLRGGLQLAWLRVGCGLLGTGLRRELGALGHQQGKWRAIGWLSAGVGSASLNWTHPYSGFSGPWIPTESTIRDQPRDRHAEGT